MPAAALVGLAALVFPASSAHAAERGAAAKSGAVCGTEHTTGLAVAAGDTVPCPTALRVAAAYVKVWKSNGAPVDVPVGRTVWRCQEEQGNPNPYQKCVNTADGAQWVTLVS
ncbi:MULTISPECIES: hypothetical protein [Streptomyces]|uniref:Secreted protein n=1 Tax=Streptomyces ramulosus TaxID=47762 RepID=A0ABW1FEU7_9ACTN